MSTRRKPNKRPKKPVAHPYEAEIWVACTIAGLVVIGLVYGGINKWLK